MKFNKTNASQVALSAGKTEIVVFDDDVPALVCVFAQAEPHVGIPISARREATPYFMGSATALSARMPERRPPSCMPRSS